MTTERVELYKDGSLKLTLTASDPGSLNNKNGYGGDATSAKIYGPTGSIATFYDDQKYRTGQNYVSIEKKVDAPVEVPIARNFVSATTEAGNGVYYGDTAQYKWVFYKNVYHPGGFLDGISLSDVVHILIEIGTVVFKQEEQKQDVAGQTSANYHVDNCSSVAFGVPPAPQ